MCTYEEVTLVHVHVLVHELKDGEPEGSEGGQGQQRTEMLQEHLQIIIIILL